MSGVDPKANAGRPLFGSTCAECRRAARALLGRAGVDSQWFKPVVRPVSEDALNYLQPSNPRLLALRRAYDEFGESVTAHSLWSRRYVDADVPLQSFRGDCAYMWQQRDLNLPLSYALTAYYYLQCIEARSLLESLGEDGAFGARTVQVTDHLAVSRDLLDSTGEILFLNSELHISDKPGSYILDIGSGYGRLAHRLLSAFQGLGGVLCADAIPESTFICEYYLKFRAAAPRARVVPLPDLRNTLEVLPVLAAVSVCCFSECPLAAAEWWLDLIEQYRIPYLFIVPSPSDARGTRLLSRERDGTRLDVLRAIQARGYYLEKSVPKYREKAVQSFGVSPTQYLLFARK